MDAYVNVQGVSKWFGKTCALSHLNVSLPQGKIIGLVGPDGAGKTTLIRLLTGLLPVSEGEIAVGGIDVAKDPDQIHGMIGYMPQKFGLYEDLSVEENLRLYADLQGIDSAEQPKVFEKLLFFSRLGSFQKRLARDLSGGMKQKLGLACALLKKPKLLLLDEPTVGVDPLSRRELWKMVLSLLHEEITVIWSTSYLDEAERCDLVLLMNEGKVLYTGEPSKLTCCLKERVFLLQGEERRTLLSQILPMPLVKDATIESSFVRTVLSKEGALKAFCKELPSSTKVKAAKPRFEDAFIDLLGGSYRGQSLIAEKMEPKPKDDKKVIEAKSLKKEFGDFVAVDGISFSVGQGEIFGLLGPNGAGKSTTFKMLCGLIRPTGGEAIVRGLSLASAPAAARAQVGYMAQKFSLYGSMTVLQNLQFFAGIYLVSHPKKAIDQMIEVFALEPYLKKSASELPLGFKQRLALACSLMHEPHVLFLDEPTAGVDPLTRREFWSHINSFVQKGMTIMVTTHFMDEAEYCDRIGLIESGKMIHLGSPEELKALVRTESNLTPTLEDAFVELSEAFRRTL